MGLKGTQSKYMTLHIPSGRMLVHLMQGLVTGPLQDNRPKTNRREYPMPAIPIVIDAS